MGAADVAYCLGLCALLLAWAFVRKGPGKVYTCGNPGCPECGSASQGSAGLRPEEAERPALSKRTIVHLSLSQRLDKRQQATPAELEALRKAARKLVADEKARMAIRDLIREAGGC